LPPGRPPRGRPSGYATALRLYRQHYELDKPLS
jgi:hypothetical protein